MERKRTPSDPIGKNLYQMSPEQTKALQLDRLPENLAEACRAFEEDSFVQKILGDHISAKYLEAKRREWDYWHRQISAWEIKEYLYKY